MPKRCAETGCRRLPWASSQFCFIHFIEHITQALPAEEQAFMRDLVDGVLKTLTWREREIIRMRFGVAGARTLTLAEIGELFKVTGERVRQVQEKALRKLQHPVRYRKLVHFIDIYPFADPDPRIIDALRLCEKELLVYFRRRPEELRRVTSDAFERIIAEIMRGLGFEVELTQKTRDGGRDIVAVGQDRLGVSTKYIVECKRYAPGRPVRVELVRSLYGVKQQQRADHAILATTSHFTKDAVEFCRSPDVWNLHLKDFEAIKEWLDVYHEMLQRGAVLL